MLESSLSSGDWCRLRVTVGWNDLTMRLNLRVRLAKRLLEGAEMALGRAAEHVWKALRIFVVAAEQRLWVCSSRKDEKK
jgi:hypothetical protein